jgi:hypothetical protein
MNGNQGRSDFPQEMNAKEPLYHTHEVNLGACRQKSTEQCFHRQVLQEVNKIVDVKAESEWGGQRDAGGIRWVPNKSQVEAWILKGRVQLKGTKDSVYFVVPVSWAAMQIIEGPLQEPVLVGFDGGSPLWRADNSDFILGENTLT